MTSFFTPTKTTTATAPFCQLPIALLKDDYFMGMSNDAKLLYSLLLNRMSLSVKNKEAFLDKSTGRFFVTYPQSEVCKTLNVGKNKASRLFAELENYDLIERKKQGLSKPDIIYVKEYIGDLETIRSNQEACYSSSKTPLKEEPVDLKKESQEAPKKEATLNSNNNLYKKSYKHQSINQSNKIINITNYNAEILSVKKQVEYEFLIRNYSDDISQINEMIELITNINLSYNSTVKINREILDIELVKKRFNELCEEHIIYVLECIKNTKQQIKNRQSYLITCLYNAPMTIEGYYDNQVQHDMSNIVDTG